MNKMRPDFDELLTTIKVEDEVNASESAVAAVAVRSGPAEETQSHADR